MDDPLPTPTIRIAFLIHLGADAILVDDEDLLLIDADLDPRALDEVIRRALERRMTAA